MSGGSGGGGAASGADDDEAPEEVTLEQLVALLSSPDAGTAAGAADALLDVPAGGAEPGERGTPWAYALAAIGAIVPLLSLVQAVRRGPDGLSPVDCPENTEAVVAAGDTALLVLAEVVGTAASLLEVRRGRYWSPRHRMPQLKNEGSKCVG